MTAVKKKSLSLLEQVLAPIVNKQERNLNGAVAAMDPVIVVSNAKRPTGPDTSATVFLLKRKNLIKYEIFFFYFFPLFTNVYL